MVSLAIAFHDVQYAGKVRELKTSTVQVESMYKN